MEQNYDIYEWELLAIMKALSHWQPYLGWTMLISSIRRHHRTSPGGWPNGMPTSRSMIMFSSTSQASPMSHPTSYHGPQMLTKGPMTTKGW